VEKHGCSITLCKGSDGWRDKAGVAMAKIAIAMIAQQQQEEEEEEAPALHSATAAALCSLSSSRGQTRSPNLVSPFASAQRGRISRKEKYQYEYEYCTRKYVINRIISIKIILKVNSNMELAIH
jgi:hypothetical protein